MQIQYITSTRGKIGSRRDCPEDPEKRKTLVKLGVGAAILATYGFLLKGCFEGVSTERDEKQERIVTIEEFYKETPAFIYDPDGHNIEACYFGARASGM